MRSELDQQRRSRDQQRQWDGQKWRGLLEDLCFEAMRTGRGSFDFQPDGVDAAPGPRVKLDAVIRSARRRLAEWREVEALIPSLDAVPHLVEKLRQDSVTLDTKQWKLLVNIDGRRSVTGLARRLDMALIPVCQLLKSLIEANAIVLETTESKMKSLPVVRLDPDSSLRTEFGPDPDPERDELDLGSDDTGRPPRPGRRSPLSVANRRRVRSREQGVTGQAQS